uniref:Uncharacterized protein n=2 Tax=Sus scrofa TaxID=9823 RepID=A0A8D1M677_PIG
TSLQSAFLKRQNCPCDKNTETCDFLLSLLIVRTSVFHLLQKENMPPKNTGSTMKVTDLFSHLFGI